MRARLVPMLLCGALALGCRPPSSDAASTAPAPTPTPTPAASPSAASTPSAKADHAALEDELALLRDAATRPRGLAALDRRIAGLTTDAEREAVGAVSTPALVAALEQLVADPRLDPNGELREALVDALAEVGDRRAVPVLITVLEQPSEAQPVAVHRRAADALGLLADEAAVDALLSAPYHVPDAFTTTNIGESSKIALAAIGEPAVPRVVDLLEGRHAPIAELARQHGIDTSNLTMFAANMLGVIGSPTAVDPLLRALPTDDCGARPHREAPEDGDFDRLALRAVIANALGLIGDERAVEPLCRCATASKDPSDMFPIAEALGRIGGPKATKCLTRVIQTGKYDRDLIESSEFQHEIRWEAIRFGILAAVPEGLPIIETAMRAKGQPAEVLRKAGQWEAGRALLERCGSDLGCAQQVLADPQADWFAREVAAVLLARRSPGSADAAERIAQAFSVANPDARVTLAWLSAHVMRGAPCPRCAAQLRDHLEPKRATKLPKEFQLSVLMARYSIARLREPRDR